MIETTTRRMTPDERDGLEERVRARVLYPGSVFVLVGGCLTIGVGGAYAIGAALALFVGSFVGMAPHIRTGIAWSIPVVVLFCVILSALASWRAGVKQKRELEARLERYRLEGTATETVWRDRAWIGIVYDEFEPEDQEQAEDGRMLLVSPHDTEDWIVVWADEGSELDRLGASGAIVTTNDGYVVLRVEADGAFAEPLDIFVEEDDDAPLDDLIYSMGEEGAVRVLPASEVHPDLRAIIEDHLASRSPAGS